MNNDYLLLTPGPLSTSITVKEAMLKDWCTWDDDYNVEIVQAIRAELCRLATSCTDYTATLMQGSGTSCVESALGSLIPNDGKLLVINNGAYGARIVEIAQYLNIAYSELSYAETQIPEPLDVETVLLSDPLITHVAMVHCETTTGILNPVKDIAKIVKKHKKVMILDAMSSFGGVPFDMHEWHIDVLISSANKCIQGVPGFGFVIAKHALMENAKGHARSLSLDLHAQWQTMEQYQGKWRFTSPTHVVRAFAQALTELQQEGGVTARHQRYKKNQSLLVAGMQAMGFKTLLGQALHSPIITAFYSPQSPEYNFKRFYQQLKSLGFVIYPGKVSNADCFRIGNIGDVTSHDITRLLDAVATAKYW
ncbi:2-aminoethylphosphonate--pyruvate transaminase [Pseudoalteromonas sp. SMS1]|uniref:2-aminoethylphosphonate--pyruvate transaminase n=1 Tax=Pseudoalteromonas sp. SMS1 TaxID=2908894 RepID=UPI001F2533B5|nr:2-aminoethylphosphonate--pyruvate transaminase [Pseudoalteromonas sp. SMS1]MCF2859976.1 2-aminoethylphosphonate--pyruvate transaminase [Pseudoalteromonas sp. SMS1]